jgi:hypothetical protein
MEPSWALIITWLVVIVVLNLVHVLLWPKVFGKTEPLWVCITLGLIIGLFSWDIAWFLLSMQLTNLPWGPSPAP